MLRKSLPLILAMLFVFAGSAAAATSFVDKCYIRDVDASPDTFKANQSINFKIHYTCQIEINSVEIEIWYNKTGGTKDQVATRYGVTLSKGTHTVDIKGNGFRGGQGTFNVLFKKEGKNITSKVEGTVCKSWSIGQY
jgi:hypothetical protein